MTLNARKEHTELDENAFIFVCDALQKIVQPSKTHQYNYSRTPTLI